MAFLGSARRTLLSRCFKSFSSPPSPTFSRRRLPITVSRIPVELGCVQSLMPLHSVTASALLTSMIASESQSWGWLSEGFATTL